jgi:hypothetical protein
MEYMERTIKMPMRVKIRSLVALQRLDHNECIVGMVGLRLPEEKHAEKLVEHGGKVNVKATVSPKK